MKTFGKTNSMQATSQTGEDNLEVRVSSLNPILYGGQKGLFTSHQPA